jgi:hypothetical protein
MSRRLWTEPLASLFWRELECCGSRPTAHRRPVNKTPLPIESLGSPEPAGDAPPASAFPTLPPPVSAFGD